MMVITPSLSVNFEERRQLTSTVGSVSVDIAVEIMLWVE